MRRGNLWILLMSAMLVAVTTIQASATSYTYDLTRWINGSGTSSLGHSLGTVTISDDAVPGYVDVDVTLNAGLNLLSLYLNYDAPSAVTQRSRGRGTSGLVSTASGFQYSPDSKLFTPGPYDGCFDILIPDNGHSQDQAVFNATISGLGNSNAASFDALETMGLFHVAAHIGEGTSTLPNFPLQSIFVGDGPSPPAVPEPASMILLGGGFFFAAVYGKRRRNP